MESMDKLVEELECLDVAAEEVGGETSGVVVSGNAFAQVVVMQEETLWRDDDDDRKMSEDGEDFVETVTECVLRKIEERARFMLAAVEQARKNKVAEEK